MICVYIYMYIYICIYSDLCGGSPLSHHTNPHTTGCVCVSVGVCMCMCVCGVCVFMCVCVVKEGLPSHTTQSHTRESVYECACVCVCVCVCMCVCACKWANIRARCGETLVSSVSLSLKSHQKKPRQNAKRFIERHLLVLH